MRNFIVFHRFKLLTVISILILITTVSFTSYSYYVYSNSSYKLKNSNYNNTFTFTCKDFNVTYDHYYSTSYEVNRVPMHDVQAWNTTTVSNKDWIQVLNLCSTSKSIKLYFVPSTSNTMDINKMRYGITQSSSTNPTFYNLNATNTTITTSIANDLTNQGLSYSGTTMYQLGSGTYTAGSGWTTFIIDFWVAYAEGNSDKSTLGKVFNGYIIVASVD